MKRRQLFYVCSAISNLNLISEILPAFSKEEAENLFQEKFKINSQKTLGPFSKKKELIVENETDIKFSNQFKEAIYKNWKVNAFALQEPQNHVFLVYLKSLDGSSTPKGSNIVPISELRIE